MEVQLRKVRVASGSSEVTQVGHSPRRQVYYWNDRRWGGVPLSPACLVLFFPGMFCSSEEQTQPLALCCAGHYCTGGAMSPTPIKQSRIGTRHSRFTMNTQQDLKSGQRILPPRVETP